MPSGACRAVVLLAAGLAAAAPRPALAWGDEGHEVIALVADALLRPDVRRLVHGMLATDEDPLTEHDIAAEATWADKYRDADPDGARTRTRQWHFVDNEIHAPSLQEACFDRPTLPPNTPASLGPARDCIVDKIDEFTAELGRRDTPPDERLIALKFLLHLVGDVHQPLHAADDQDRGGNDERVSASGFRANNLHHFWDTEFVAALGPGPREIATSLLQQASAADIRRWSVGSAAEWALESFQLAAQDAYGRLSPPNRRGNYPLTDEYVAAAIRDCRLQLTKAGVRLALVLNRTLSRG